MQAVWAAPHLRATIFVDSQYANKALATSPGQQDLARFCCPTTWLRSVLARGWPPNALSMDLCLASPRLANPPLSFSDQCVLSYMRQPSITLAPLWYVVTDASLHITEPTAHAYVRSRQPQRSADFDQNPDIHALHCAADMSRLGELGVEWFG